MAVAGEVTVDEMLVAGVVGLPVTLGVPEVGETGGDVESVGDAVVVLGVTDGAGVVLEVGVGVAEGPGWMLSRAGTEPVRPGRARC